MRHQTNGRRPTRRTELRPWHGRAGSALAVLAPLVLVAPGRAMADDRASAQELFDQGKALLTAGNVAEACPKFEGAAQLSATPGVRLNLADCWAKLGRTASAWGTYEEALVIAQRTGDTAAADAARKGRAAMEPSLSYLTIIVTGNADIPGLAVSRDGRTLPRTEWGTPIPVDPGEHIIEAIAPAGQRWSARKTVTAGGDRESVSVPAPTTDSPPPPPTAPLLRTPPGATSLPATEAPTGGGSTRRALALVSGGVGLVGIGIGTAFGLDALFKKNAYQGTASSGAGGTCPTPQCHEQSVQADHSGNISTVAFIVGGALVAAGATLWLTAPSQPSGLSARLTAIGGPRTAGAAVIGSWR